MSLTLSRDTLQHFKVAKTFRLQEKEVSPITSLNFDDNGKFLLTASANDNMHLYDAVSCKFLNTIGSKKYGCHSAKFTHAQNECIYSSTMLSFDIRHLNLETNQYLRYFTGHGALVHDLQMSPLNDTFLSASYDESVRLWDLRSSKAQAIVPSVVPNCIAYDPSGLVFALGNPETNEIGLYNLKQLNKGPFLIINLTDKLNQYSINRFKKNWNKLEFSNDGKYLLVGSSYGKNLILDAFNGNLLFELTGTKSFPTREFLDSGSVCFTPDGKYTVGTDYLGKVVFWNHSDAISFKTLKPMSSIPAAHDSCPRTIAFNPKYSMFVTADENVDFYVYDN